ncbi:MAG: polyphosphate polymerase domain-containing protein [Clostridia bacterium]|nr:polyphosphate polymerase domain-containing protein [Clostridia bacterium]
MASSNVFRRVEKKYTVTTAQMEMLKENLSHILRSDIYPTYTICNVYYDTKDNDLIRRSIEKPDFKEKMRLRSYGVPHENDTVFLEIKRKYDGTVYKRRISATYRELDGYLTKGISPVSGQIFDEVEYFRSIYDLSPKMFIAYDRCAFCGRDDENLRLTFDSNIRYRTEDVSLLVDKGQQLLECGLHIMEIKANGAMPLEMADILSKMGVYPSSFSKYGKAYIKEHLKGKEQQHA